MKHFRAKHGTHFYWRNDLSGRILFSETFLGLRHSVDAEDFMEFACTVAGMPPWDPIRDDHDRETERLMKEHVASCSSCGVARCEAYWKLVLGRIREKERKFIQ